MEDFLLLEIPNLHAPIPYFIWVPTTKLIGLESGFGKVRFEYPTPIWEVLQFRNPPKGSPLIPNISAFDLRIIVSCSYCLYFFPQKQK
jgi:hypothetical protein